jgi:hypothetical protein
VIKLWEIRVSVIVNKKRLQIVISCKAPRESLCLILIESSARAAVTSGSTTSHIPLRSVSQSAGQRRGKRAHLSHSPTRAYLTLCAVRAQARPPMPARQPASECCPCAACSPHSAALPPATASEPAYDTETHFTCSLAVLADEQVPLRSTSTKSHGVAGGR